MLLENGFPNQSFTPTRADSSQPWAATICQNKLITLYVTVSGRRLPQLPGIPKSYPPLNYQATSFFHFQGRSRFPFPLTVTRYIGLRNMLPWVPEATSPSSSQLQFQFLAPSTHASPLGRILSATRRVPDFSGLPSPKYTFLDGNKIPVLLNESSPRKITYFSRGISIDNPKDPTLPLLDPWVNLLETLPC